MDILVTLGYGAVYFAGHYGAHLLNLLMRRVMFANLQMAGLVFLSLVAVAAYFVIEAVVPESLSPVERGFVQGKFVVGPALIVGVCVALRMWYLNRKLRRPNDL